MSIRKPHHGRGGSRHIGRVRISAAKILNAAFPDIEATPDNIYPATGRHRTDWRQDVVRWELFAFLRGTRVPFVGQSWQRLTEFVQNARAGGTVRMDRDGDIWCDKPGN